MSPIVPRLCEDIMSRLWLPCKQQAQVAQWVRICGTIESIILKGSWEQLNFAIVQIIQTEKIRQSVHIVSLTATIKVSEALFRTNTRQMRTCLI
jgi:hypothetical protein